MSLDRFRLGGWAASGFCLALAGGTILVRRAAFLRAGDHRRAVSAELVRAENEARELDRTRQKARFACAPAATNEETKFLKGLRRHARLAGVAIVRLDSHSTTYQKESAQGGPAATDERTLLLDGVTKVATDLTLDGSYTGLRQFLMGLWSADRLYTLSNVGWTRADGGSELTLTLSRYVAPTAQASTPNSSTP